jgi:hypothetical protein
MPREVFDIGYTALFGVSVFCVTTDRGMAVEANL